MAHVSVVIPSYQHERFLGAALDSLEAQTRPPDEIVVVDDGSKDGSVALVKARLRPGLRLLEQENRGAHAALNRGIEEATGDVVFLLNSDDRFVPERVEKLAGLLETGASSGLVSSWIRLVDAKGKALGVKEAWRNMHPWPARRPERTFVATQDARWNLLQGNYLATTSNFAFRRELWRKAGPFLPLRFAHDWDFALTAALDVAPTIVEEPLLEYRIHEKNTIRTNPREMELEALWVVARHLGRFTARETTGAQEAGLEFLSRLAESLHSFGKERLLTLLVALARDEHPGSPFDSLLERESPLRRWALEELSR
jgi:glycosyltransferase involved in cell wall biosynthesis